MKSLVALSQAYKSVNEIIHEIVDVFSFPIFLIITELGASIIYDSYYVVMPFLLPSFELSWILTANSLFYVLTYVFPIVIVVTSMDRIATEMKRTAPIVHDLYTKAGLDRNVKSHFKLLSLNLLHQKICFTAYHIFPLDNTLIGSIFSMTVAYLVIVIQFQIL
nr:PREDICTED: putative gustatory receptor 28a [Fopius arisanus]